MITVQRIEALIIWAGICENFVNLEILKLARAKIVIDLCGEFQKKKRTTPTIDTSIKIREESKPVQPNS